MNDVDAQDRRGKDGFLRRVTRGALRALRLGFEGLVLAWTTLAIYFSNLPWAWSRVLLAAIVAVFGVRALWMRRRPRSVLAFWAVFALVAVWFSLIPPSQDRNWRREVAVMPTATIDGDRVRLTGVRNFSYRTRDDFDERWEEREVLLSHLTSVDFYISFWMPGPIGHTFLSFNFDNAPPVSISISV